MRRLSIDPETWPLASTFRISRGAKTEARVVVVTVSDGAHAGRGECVPYPRYGETVESVIAAIEAVRAAVELGLDREALQAALPPGAARNALDCALWDLAAKQAGVRVWELAGTPAPAPVLTAKTIGLDTPDNMAAAARRDAACPLLKLKVTGDGDLARVAAVKEGAPSSRLVVDANEGWEPAILGELLPGLADLGVEMVEQPLPAGDDAALAGYVSPVALCADEACHTRDDLAGLAGRYGMVNIKLDKTGGLTEALALVRDARAAGFGIMVGCMVGTSLAMAPAMVLTPFADIVDLDGPLLLAEDRNPGLAYDGTTIDAPEPALWG